MQITDTFTACTVYLTFTRSTVLLRYTCYHYYPFRYYLTLLVWVVALPRHTFTHDIVR